MTELYINGFQIDLFETEIIPLNFSLNDVREIFKRQTNYSKIFKVPNTLGNQKIFQDLFQINTDQNLWLVENIPAVLYYDSIEIFRGQASLINILYEGGNVVYEIKLLGKSKTLFDEIGNAELTDLVWSEDTEHEFNATNIKNNWWDSETRPWFYPLLDYGGFLTGITSDYPLNEALIYTRQDEWNIYFRPAVFVKSIIDEIFKTHNYTYDCELFETSWFKKLFIPFGNEELNYSVGGDEIFSGEVLGPKSYDNDSANNLAEFTEIIPLSPILDDFNNWNSFKNRYQVPKSGNYELEITLTLDEYDNNYTNGGRLIINNNDSSGNFIKGFESEEFTSEGLYTFTLNLKELEAYTYLKFYIRPAYSFFNLPQNTTRYRFLFGNITYSNLNLALSNKEIEGVIFGSTKKLKVSDFIIKGIKQKDFLISIFQMFNLYLELDPLDSKKYLIQPRDDFFYAGQSLNWTDKLIEPLENNLIPYDFSTFIFDWSEEEDFHNKIYTNQHNLKYGSREIKNTNPYTQKNLRKKLIFAPTPFIYNQDELVNSYHYINSSTIYPTAKLGWKNIKGSDGDPIYENTGGTKPPVLKTPNYKIKPRILMKWTADINNLFLVGYGGPDNGTVVNITYSTGVQFDYNNQQIELGFRQGFSEYLLDGSEVDNTMPNLYNYWSNFINNVFTKDSRIITVFLALKASDIKNLSLRNKIYINFGKYGSGWFLINKIIDYDPQIKKTKVELIKIIDPSYLGLEYIYTPITPLISQQPIILDGGYNTNLTTAGILDGGYNTNLTTAGILDGKKNKN